MNDFQSVPSNISKEEWEVLTGLANDRSIVIKQATKVLARLFGVEMTTSMKLINCLKRKTYIKISTVKKQLFKTWRIKPIEFLRAFRHTILLQRKNSNTFLMISKKKDRVATQPGIQANQGKVREFDFGL